MSKLPYPSAGQIVICINDKWFSNFDHSGQRVPVKGDVYTIKAVEPYRDRVYVTLREVTVIFRGEEAWFSKGCFRPVKDTDISDLLVLRNPSPHDFGRINRYDAATRDRWNAPSREREGA